MKIFENTKVERILVENGRATGVQTDKGTITADAVVNAAGMWARELGDQVGATVPLHAAEHFYIVTEAVEGISPTMPVLRDMDGCGYFKEDAGKLLVGWFEPGAKPWGMKGISEEFSFTSLPEDFEHIAPLVENATIACRSSRRQEFVSSSTAPSRSRRTIAICLASSPK